MNFVSFQLSRSGSDSNVKRQYRQRFERCAADRQNVRIKKVSGSFYQLVMQFNSLTGRTNTATVQQRI